LSLAGTKRKPATEETKKKMSDALRGRKMSEEFKKKIKDSWVIRKQKKAV